MGSKRYLHLFKTDKRSPKNSGADRLRIDSRKLRRMNMHVVNNCFREIALSVIATNNPRQQMAVTIPEESAESRHKWCRVQLSGSMAKPGIIGTLSLLNRLWMSGVREHCRIRDISQASGVLMALVVLMPHSLLLAAKI